jgi:hypothetical protein
MFGNEFVEVVLQSSLAQRRYQAERAAISVGKACVDCHEFQAIQH